MFKILVVEDDKDLNRSVCLFLNQNGYSATGCLSAREAYDAMYENIYDLILSDIMMPEIDGFDFAKTVRSLNEAIPILFMSARDDFASKERGYRTGIDDYMVKPIDFEELLLRIGALLRRAPDQFPSSSSVGNDVLGNVHGCPSCKTAVVIWARVSTSFTACRRTAQPWIWQLCSKPQQSQWCRSGVTMRLSCLVISMVIGHPPVTNKLCCAICA